MFEMFIAGIIVFMSIATIVTGGVAVVLVVRWGMNVLNEIHEREVAEERYWAEYPARREAEEKEREERRREAEAEWKARAAIQEMRDMEILRAIGDPLYIEVYKLGVPLEHILA